MLRSRLVLAVRAQPEGAAARIASRDQVPNGAAARPDLRARQNGMFGAAAVMLVAARPVRKGRAMRCVVADAGDEENVCSIDLRQLANFRETVNTKFWQKRSIRVENRLRGANVRHPRAYDTP